MSISIATLAQDRALQAGIDPVVDRVAAQRASEMTCREVLTV
jgi:hypothetical protein